jgi:hypothetical protein
MNAYWNPIPIPSQPTPPPLPPMFNDDIYPPAKDYVSQPLYVRQPCSLQIIQLVECSPPPPQQKYAPERLSSSSYSDSDSDSDGSAYDSSSSSLSAGSSYCSSAEDSAPPVPPSFDNRDPSVDDTYHTRQRRVSLWRDAVYSKDVPSPSPSPTSNTSGSSPFCYLGVVGWDVYKRLLYFSRTARPASPSQKRKTPDGDLANNDSVVSSVRASISPTLTPISLSLSRQTSHVPRKSTRSTPSAHSCPACDEDFSSPLSLRQHASSSRSANEACRIAVEYGFEGQQQSSRSL